MDTDLEVFHHVCCNAFRSAHALLRNARRARVEFPIRQEWLRPNCRRTSKLSFSTIDSFYGSAIDHLKGAIEDLYPLIAWIPNTALEAITSLSEYDKENYFEDNPTDRRGLPSARYGRCVRVFSNACPAPIRLGPLFATSYHEMAAEYAIRVTNAACSEYSGRSLLDLAIEIRQTPIEEFEDYLTRWGNRLKKKSKKYNCHPGYGYYIDPYLLNDVDVDDIDKITNYSYEVIGLDNLTFKTALEKEFYRVGIDRDDEREPAAMQSHAPSANSDANHETTGDTELTPSTPDGPIKPDGFRWDNKTIEGLTPTEFDLLAFIFERRDNPPKIEELKDVFWKDSHAKEGSFHKHAGSLRDKLEPLGIIVCARRKTAVIRPLKDGKKKSVRDI
jgi:hypothetical protein